MNPQTLAFTPNIRIDKGKMNEVNEMNPNCKTLYIQSLYYSFIVKGSLGSPNGSIQHR